MEILHPKNKLLGILFIYYLSSVLCIILTSNEAVDDSMLVMSPDSKYSLVLVIQKLMPMPVRMKITSAQSIFNMVNLVLYK